MAISSLNTLLADASIILDAHASDRDSAIRLAGDGLLAVAAIDGSYVDAMIDRENTVSTFLGNAVAVPHGTLSSKDSVHSDALSLVRLPAGVDWDGHDVRLVFGIAARGSGYIAVLSRLATALIDPSTVSGLLEAATIAEVRVLLDAAGDPE